MKCYITPKKVQEKEAIRQYKRQYYLLNKISYNQRNMTASQNKTIERIEALSTPLIIYKLEYILNHLTETS
jgi:hypothetical protein